MKELHFAKSGELIFSASPPNPPSKLLAKKVLPSGLEVFLWSELDAKQLEQVTAVKDPKIIFETLSAFFPAMPTAVDEFTEHLTLGAEVSTDKVFFGGSFSPWHEGHGACLRLIREAKPEAEIVIVPDRNPWKNYEQGSSLEDYFSLTEKAEAFGASVYPGFLLLEQANPTIDWMRLVRGKKSLLVGADHLRDFRKWKNYLELLESLESLFIAPRTLSGSEYDDLEKIREDLQRETKKPLVLLSRHAYEDLSSTEIRQKKRP